MQNAIHAVWILLFFYFRTFHILRLLLFAGIFLVSVHRTVVFCSVLIVLLIGVERYTLVRHPLKSLGWWTWKKVCLLLTIILVDTAGVAIPIGSATRYGDFVKKDNTTQKVCSVPVSRKYLASSLLRSTGCCFLFCAGSCVDLAVR